MATYCQEISSYTASVSYKLYFKLFLELKEFQFPQKRGQFVKAGQRACSTKRTKVIRMDLDKLKLMPGCCQKVQFWTS